MPFHHNVFHWKPNEVYRRWTLPLRHGSIWERNDLLESGHSYSFRGPDTLLHRNSHTFVVDGTTHTPATPVPSDFSKKTTFFDILSDGEWWVFCDSSYRSTDEGATWHTGGTGLPRRSDGVISNISTLIRLSDSTLLCGMRGIRRLSGDTDPDTIRVQAGGIWRSDDNGATWTPSDVGLGEDDYVFQIQSLGNGILLASSSLIFRDPELDNEFRIHRPQAYSAIVRSTNNGHTWEQVYVERRNRPASECQRTFVNAGNGRVFAATVEHGVLESRDFGRTWAPVAEGLEDRVIYDLAVGTDGGLWAGTDKGIHYVMPSVPVSVAEHNGQHRDPEITVPADRLRYTSVWSYPNPSRDHLTVRVNTADLTGSGLLTLTLHDILGSTIDDLTERLLPNRSQRRVEFDYATSHLPTGMYFLVLETSAGKEMSKVFVLR